MQDYFVFGGTLRSELGFPDLPPARKPAPDWTLRIRVEPPPAVPLSVCGEFDTGYATARLYRTPAGHRLVYAETGSYDISAGSSELIWYPGPDAPLQLVRAIILGPVFSLIFQQAGMLCLHGSAVEVGGQGIVFVAPKFSGKSTLAFSLTAAGARLVTDDTAILDPRGTVMLWPGVHGVRLWADSADTLRAAKLAGTFVPSLKRLAAGLPSERLLWEPVPLAAIYLLESVEAGDGGPAAARTPTPPARAAAGLGLQTRLADPLIGYASAAVDLRRAAEVVRQVPIYRLSVVRDFGRLPEVVGQIFEWHEMEAAVPGLAR
jgi:hypothetical protein